MSEAPEQPAPLVFVAKTQDYVDNRGVIIIERTIVEGITPRGFERFIVQLTVGANSPRGPVPIPLEFPVAAEDIGQAFAAVTEAVVNAEATKEFARRKEAQRAQQAQSPVIQIPGLMRK